MPRPLALTGTTVHTETLHEIKKTKKISVKVNNITNIKQEALLLLR